MSANATNQPASKYPLRWSESKGAFQRIEDLPTPHAMNAHRKERAKGDTEVGRALEQELRARGCTLDEESQRWTVPQKSEEGTP